MFPNFKLVILTLNFICGLFGVDLVLCSVHASSLHSSLITSLFLFLAFTYLLLKGTEHLPMTDQVQALGNSLRPVSFTVRRKREAVRLMCVNVHFSPTFS